MQAVQLRVQPSGGYPDGSVDVSYPMFSEKRVKSWHTLSVEPSRAAVDQPANGCSARHHAGHDIALSSCGSLLVEEALLAAPLRSCKSTYTHPPAHTISSVPPVSVAAVGSAVSHVNCLRLTTTESNSRFATRACCQLLPPLPLGNARTHSSHEEEGKKKGPKNLATPGLHLSLPTAF
jgi:hypothetical protein